MAPDSKDSQPPPPARRPSSGKPHTRDRAPPHALGLGARIEAVRLVEAVTVSHISLDEALLSQATATGAAPPAGALEPRDRAFARLIAATVLRRKGELEAVIGAFLGKPLPGRTGTLWPILLAGAAQLLMLETPAHAAISLAVEQVRLDRRCARFDKLVNALLRRIATEGPARLVALDAVALDYPLWLIARWRRSYGEATARAIATACQSEAPLDLTAKSDPAALSATLSGRLLPTGTIRLEAGGRIEDVEGYASGEWWVQDAGAALPARLLAVKPGEAVADLCAAPGGKTGQLASQGALVTAVESSARRIDRVKANLARLGLTADLVIADVRQWRPGTTFDAVLLDAPCSSTGTIRRHPDIPHLKRDTDIAVLAKLQGELLDASARLVRPGGRLVYCTCSLEPEEGEGQWRDFLKRHPEFKRLPVSPEEVGHQPHWITPDGDIRTLPGFGPVDADGAPIPGGIDGFFVGRGVRG